MNIHVDKLHALMGMVVNEIGAAQNAALVILGEKLGLYRKLAAEPAGMTSEELAATTGTAERYVREWLSAQAASGFVTYDQTTNRFFMTREQTAVFGNPDSTTYMAGGFAILSAVYAGEPRLTEAFRTGEGIGWDEHCNCLFCGTERFFRSGYLASLVGEWLPALDGVVEKLRRGIKVADIGCGHGASTAIMAEAFPNSEFVGFDYHEGSVAEARRQCAHLPNVRFEVARAQDLPERGFGFAAIFDALHDMGDPVGAVRNIRRSIDPDGTLMIVEPMAGDTLAENLNPVGRVFYAASTHLCVPASLRQEVGAALGAQAGEKRLSEVIRQGGFGHVRRAYETPFNMVLEARP